MNRTLSFLVSLLLVSSVAFADENLPGDRTPGAGVARHYLITAAHVLTPEEQAQLADDGIVVQQVLPQHHYLIRTADTSSLIANPNIRAIDPFGAAYKLAPLARRVMASTRPFVSVNVRFHDDVTLDQAREATEAVGGTIETLFPLASAAPQRLRIRVPPAAISRLAADERVFGIFGPPLKAAPVNSVAASLSHVTPLYTAPYNLDGTGVVLSMHEPSSDCDTAGNNCDSAVDASHKEFGGRVTLHDPDKVAEHGTHVAGTMIAQGIDPQAKGMAPNATLQMYNVTGDDASISDKGNTLPGLNVTGNNNSWGFQLGWQPDPLGFWVWFGATEYFGNYDDFYSAPYDTVATTKAPNVLFVHSSGNDADQGNPILGTFSPHKHVDDNFNTVTNETFCYSQNGSGTDCPSTSCSSGISTKVHDDNGNPVPHCEKTRHPVYGPFNTLSFIAAEKNILAVGAVDQNLNIAGFSSRGPAADGRVKPDLVAMGVGQYSTLPGSQYGILNGTSMSSPVVTGISALVVQQWRQTFGGNTPTAQQVKTVLIAGADDLGNPGPDYTFGFGLVDAQASVDLIRADNNTGARIRTASVGQGQTVDVPMTVSTAGKVRVVVGWADPAVSLPANSFADATLVNDIDVKVVDPNGVTTLPYVLDKSNPSSNAARAANHIDNTEEIEIPNAQPGVYHVQITGTTIAVNPPQTYVLVANQALTSGPPPCGDVYEPNDTPATAYCCILNQQKVTARICSSSDIDYFNIQVPTAGPLQIVASASDTPVRVTLSGPGNVFSSVTLNAGQSQTIQVTAGAGTYTVKVEPNGTVGSDAHYTFTPTFTVTFPKHTRRAGH